MESNLDYWSAKAALDWQIEMGVDEAICDAPIDRYTLADKLPAAKVVPVVDDAKPEAEAVDPVAVATSAAAAAQDLDGLHAALVAFEHCALKGAARNLVFSNGVAGSDVMILTDPPDRDEDRAGTLFAGRTGVLLDKMLAAIGLSRSTGRTVYAAPILPWNPPQNREPNAAEVAMMLPFLHRHIDLARPRVLVLMGNGPCHALLKKTGMTRLRGRWTTAHDLPALPMFPPSFLLSNPNAKRDAWADLLSLKAHLKDPS